MAMMQICNINIENTLKNENREKDGIEGISLSMYTKQGFSDEA
jgi:hypothetical protein